MHKYFFFILIVIINIPVFSQDLPFCGSDEMRMENLLKENSIAQAVAKREKILEDFTLEYKQKQKSTSTIYTIPVVFHVIHVNGTENIEDEQIYDAMRILNETFRKTRPDSGIIVSAFKPIHADCEIEFKLAQKDPFGVCTKGINRIYSSLTEIGDHSVKNLIQWPTNQYLNVYVVKNAAGLAGHAVWPSDADTIPQWDGIVMSHNYVGSIGTSNPTRSVVLAHECGHYLNLHHIWGGNNVPGYYYYPCCNPGKDCTIDDFVMDTPPTIGWQTCNLSASSCGNAVDNVQNVMDYSYCNIMFTQGQKDRMHACLNSSIAGRNNLWSTLNLINTGVLNDSSIFCSVEFKANRQVICESITNSITFSNTSYHGVIDSVLWYFPGADSIYSTADNPTITYSVPGNYPVTLTVYQNNVSYSLTKPNYINVLPLSGHSYPFGEDFEYINNLQANNWFSYDYNIGYTWELSDQVSAKWGTKSIMVHNYNANYEIKTELYSPVVDISNVDSAFLFFSYAYASKNDENTDRLQVFLNKNCNAWQPRLTLTASQLKTSPNEATIPFFPDETEWRDTVIYIPIFFYSDNFRFRFSFEGRGGNNIFIDNINVDRKPLMASNRRLDKLKDANITIYPNPVQENLYVKTNIHSKNIQSVKVLDMLGIQQNIYWNALKNNLIEVDLKNVQKGVYILNIHTHEKSFSTIFLVN